MLNNALFYSKFGMNVIPCSYKLPKVKWGDYTSTPLTDAPSRFNWETNAIAGISGVNSFTVLDFDKADLSKIDTVLDQLKLPPLYDWVVESGSGNGFHIWFRFIRTPDFVQKFGSAANIFLLPAEPSLCDHLELRLHNCYTLLPPSSHVSGLAYSFYYNEPTAPPPFIPEEVITEFIYNHCKFNPGNNYSVIRKPVAPVKLSVYSRAKLISAVEFLAMRLGAGCYPLWNKLGLALCSLGTEGLHYFKILSANPNYNDSERKIEDHFSALLKSYNGSISVASVFYTAQSYGWKIPFYPFWKFARNKIIFDYNSYICFLHDHNFSKMPFNGRCFLCYTEGSFINLVDEVFLKDYVYLYIKNLQGEREDNLREMNMVLDQMIKCFPLFKRDTLEFLPDNDQNIIQDSAEEAFIFFRNCYLRITSERLEPLGYDTLDGYVYAERVIKRNFHHPEKSSVFESFCRNICRGDEVRFGALKSAIGYLLHTYKTQVNAKAVVFTDENISDGAAGRSGKSLLAKALGQIRTLVEIDGRNFSFNDRFAFQRVTPASEILLFNDVDKKFPFEKLYNIISDSFTVQKKNESEYTLDFSNSPKVAITNNNTILNNDPSSRARLFEIEFSDHYNISHTPIKEFGKRFFDDWDSGEWCAFYLFMAECIRFYLKFGLCEYPFSRLWKKKIGDATSSEFDDFMEENIVFNEYVPKTEFFARFREEEPAFADMKSNTFFKWVKYYCRTYGYRYVEKRKGHPVVRHFAIGRDDAVV